MTPNNNVSILPIYNTLAEQNSRKDYSFGEEFSLITPNGTILPFQKVRTTRPDTVDQITVKLKDKLGNIIEDIEDEMRLAGLKINRYQSYGFDVIIFPGTVSLGMTFEEGKYYLEIFDGAETFYSEVFHLVSDVSNFLKIEFWDSENMAINEGVIDFTDDFKFRVYLDTQVGRPDYEFEEEVTQRDGYQFVEKQISEKTYKFNFLAPEFLCDALRIVRMMDNISISSRGHVYTADQFLISPKWQSGGFFAAVEAEFQCDTIIKKTGARFVPISNDDPNLNVAKIYVGSLVDAVPTELQIKALTELPAIKQNITFSEYLAIGKRFCVAYPASFGDLKEAFVLESFDILSVFNKITMDFTFGTETVSMFVYVYASPTTYLTTPNPERTIHYNFTPAKSSYIVGDVYAGGIIAYLFEDGDEGFVEGETHGIIAAPYDTPASIGAQWSKSYLGLTGSAATAIGQGKQNTLNIILSLGFSLLPYYAAYAARNVGIGDYSDWFLPCKDELGKIVLHRSLLNMELSFYWSSSESDASNAFYYSFMTNDFQTAIKTTPITIGVRAIRYF